jgi:hypothetical protein
VIAESRFQMVAYAPPQAETEPVEEARPAVIRRVRGSPIIAQAMENKALASGVLGLLPG